MQALKVMASGAPLDMQRAARWPSQETTVDARGTKGLTVEWEPYQIDSDYDDLEGLYPPPEPTGPKGGDDDQWAS